jgi:uncharacterized OB-fold protein
MDNIFDKFRSGAEKAAFEADKLRRVTAVQGVLRSLKSDMEREIGQAGQVAFTLHQRQQISQPELLEACERLAAVHAQIQAREREIEAIRAETYEANANQPRYGRLCPNGHGPIPPQDNFCQKCGARAIEVPPPAGRQCPNCGVALAADARFCASCGQQLQAPPPPAAVAPSQENCPACGATLLPDALFCAECGHKVKSAMAVAPPSPELPEEVDAFVWLDEPEEMPVAEAVLSSEEAVEPMAAEPEIEPADFAMDLTVVEAAPTEVEGVGEEWSETAVTDPPSATETDTPLFDVASTEQTPATCPACQAALLPEAIFCAECGHRLS